MAFVFIQGLTYVYGALYMLLALWTTYNRAMAGDGIILRFLEMHSGDHHIRSATLSALVYKCADILMLLLIATGASAWLVDMFVKKAREICSNRSASATTAFSFFSVDRSADLHHDLRHHHLRGLIQRGTNKLSRSKMKGLGTAAH